MRSASYREFSPPRQLADYVSCFWVSTVAAGQSPRNHRVLPDGCIDIIFDVSLGQSPQASVVGTMTTALTFASTTERRYVAIRFRPGGGFPFLSVPAEKLTDLKGDLTADWEVDAVADRICGTRTDEGRVRQLQAMLLLRLPGVPTVDPRIQTAVSIFKQTNFRIENVASKLGVSRQHLTRLFRRHVGVGPKIFSRVARMQKLIQLIENIDQPNWANVAQTVGYSDQPHMISDLRALTGMTLSQLNSR